ncbi:hypothetical protein Q6322_29650, partial [Klebsiella pneumoniae]|uniref:hypothetical protein n=1 Tax=Klebsiella pneumoniae TaxID=573 RepID=UPI002730EAA7
MLPMYYHHHRLPLDLYSQHRDWGRGKHKDTNKRHPNLQLGSGSTEGIKEPSAAEDRELDISG